MRVFYVCARIFLRMRSDRTGKNRRQLFNVRVIFFRMQQNAQDKNPPPLVYSGNCALIVNNCKAKKLIVGRLKTLEK